MNNKEDSYNKDGIPSRGRFKKDNFNSRTEHLDA